MKADVWAGERLKEIDAAWNKHGRHDFFDKGPDAVMRVDTIVTSLRGLSGEEAGRHLQSLAESSHEGSARLAQSILSSLDDQPDEWWESCVEVAKDVEY